MLETVEGLVARIPDGASVAVPAGYSGCAMSAVRSLICRGVSELELITVPQAGFQADHADRRGLRRRARDVGGDTRRVRSGPAVPRGRVEQSGSNDPDSTCPGIHTGLPAAEKGVLFLPLRGILASDL